MIYSKRAFAATRAGVVMVSAAAWATIAVLSMGAGQGPAAAFICGPRGTSVLTLDWVLSASPGWMLMVIAMMAPMVLPPLVHIRISSFAHRRWRSTALFLAGYAAVWLLACLVLEALEAVASRGLQNPYALAGLAAAIAALWQVSPPKQWCLNQCHAHRPLAAFGWRADGDALRFGLEQGVWCVGSCWALMLLATALPQWPIAGMLVASMVMFCERLDPPTRPAWRLRGFRTAWQRLRLAYAHKRHAWFAPQPGTSRRASV